MKLIIGLGNPGSKYEKTRHNFGFMAIDHIQKGAGSFENWKLDNTANAFIAKGQIEGREILLAKPQTFMNLSGKTAGTLANFFKIKLEDIFVIHDDFDLPLGVIRINKNISNGGHKGVKSVIEALGTKDFIRFRLGIRPQGQTFFSAIFKRVTSTEKFVLKNFSRDESHVIAETIQKTAQAVESVLKDGIEMAMNKFN